MTGKKKFQSSVWWVHDRCYDRKKKIQSSVWRVRDHYYNWKKKFQSSVWRVRDRYYDRKKKVLVVIPHKFVRKTILEKKSSSRLSGGCAIVITTGKKCSSCLFGGCAIVITNGKKFQSSVWQVRDYYYFYHRSDLREIIRFFTNECIEFECNEFV